MHRLIKPIFWTFLFLVMMLVIDQILVQVPPIHPAHAAVSNFYQDFRKRLTDLAFGEKKATPKSIEAVIAKQQKENAPKKTEQTKEPQAEATAAPQTKKSQRYIYSDGKGELHFADSLDDVPDEYRGLAQPMGK
ncbi:hypothetical protein P9J64_12160 [Deltaproteobacteria bacterium IMCC39524]|nr:hypothetical protein [Deltaproteobacteria bacterium IMCC39524]